MVGGDYRFYQGTYSDKSTNVSLAAADAGKVDMVTVKNANYTVYIQKITYNPITAAAQAITIRDDAGTPVVLAVVPASQATPITFDFGPEGFPLTVGKNLDASNVAGPAGTFHIEAYEKLGTTGNHLSGASLQ